MASLEEVKKSIQVQGLNWEAGTTVIGERFEKAGVTGGLGLAIRKGREPGGGPGKLKSQKFAFTGQAPPSYVDWRQVDGENWVSRVNDQGVCGACVAFATCSSLEARARILRQDPHLGLTISTAQLFFCGAGATGCEDGWYTGFALKFCRENGVGKEADFRYKAKQLKCKKINPLLKVPRWRRLEDNRARREALFKRGPVIGGMIVFEDFLWYRGGVYRPTSAEAVGRHAVCVIGYDDEKGCWLVQNSWGAAWGEGGFCRIGFGTCGIDTQFEFYDAQVEIL